MLPEDGGEEEAHVGFFEGFHAPVVFEAYGHAVGEFAGGVEVEGVELEGASGFALVEDVDEVVVPDVVEEVVAADVEVGAGGIDEAAF